MTVLIHEGLFVPEEILILNQKYYWQFVSVSP
jgi:hypothetical protein